MVPALRSAPWGEPKKDKKDKKEEMRRLPLGLFDVMR